jgi:hypothetical protein
MESAVGPPRFPNSDHPPGCFASQPATALESSPAADPGEVPVERRWHSIIINGL